MEISGYAPFVTLMEKKMQFYVATIGCVKKQMSVHRPLGIEDYLILYTVQGKGKCFIDGNEYILGSDSLLFLPPGTAHEYNIESIEWETLYITFNGNGMKDFFDDKAKICPKAKNFMNFIERYKKISLYKKDPQKYKEQSVELYSLLLDLSGCLECTAKKNSKNIHKLTAAMHYLSEKPENDLKKLSEDLGISEEHLCRSFKKYTGYRPIEYANIVRIQKAKFLLRNTNRSVSEIADETGFYNHSYFAAVFKKYVGKTPSLYRADFF